MEAATELDGDGEEEDGPGEAWGTESPGCSGGGGGGAEDTNPPSPPTLPLPPLPPKCSKRPTPGCSCSGARAASVG